MSQAPFASTSDPSPHDPAHVEPWFLRPKDLERLTGVAQTTVRDAISRGDLQARKFRGRGWLIAVEDARRWIDEQTVPNSDPLA